MSIADQISNLPDEDQQQFHEYVLRSLRKQWAKAKEKTEREQNEIDKRRPQ